MLDAWNAVVLETRSLQLPLVVQRTIAPEMLTTAAKLRLVFKRYLSYLYIP
jgi:hypothetical protein